MERFDVIIAGAGIAGLAAALEASKQKGKSIAVLDRFDGTKSNSHYAQGGIACAFGKNDSWKKHYEDTMSAGAGLCDNKIVELVTRNGPEAVKELIGLGLVFDGEKNPEPGLEGGHSEKRILHIGGDKTGEEITKFMKKIAKEKGNVYFLEKAFLAKINTEKSRYTGIETIGKEQNLISNSLIMATGGYAACFGKTTNPETTIGTGIGVANSAGCGLGGMEFVQFHPTTLKSAIGNNYLVSEAVRGEGGIIVNEKGERIVNPLDTRDKVCIAIYNELQRGRKVFLDAREFEPLFFAERFPTVYSELMKRKINPEKDLIPIEAAAHYTIGGVKVDENARTSIRGIYAAGECTYSGLHGANRLASNSLLEGLVFGGIAGRNAAGEKVRKTTGMKPAQNPETEEKEGFAARTASEAAKKVMWRCCGIVREEAKLREGLAGMKNLEEKIETKNTIESIAVRNALIVCRKTLEAALSRKESVGVHYRVD